MNTTAENQNQASAIEQRFLVSMTRQTRTIHFWDGSLDESGKMHTCRVVPGNEDKSLPTFNSFAQAKESNVQCNIIVPHFVYEIQQEFNSLHPESQRKVVEFFGKNKKSSDKYEIWHNTPSAGLLWAYLTNNGRLMLLEPYRSKEEMTQLEAIAHAKSTKDHKVSIDEAASMVAEAQLDAIKSATKELAMVALQAKQPVLGKFALPSATNVQVVETEVIDAEVVDTTTGEVISTNTPKRGRNKVEMPF